MRFGQNVLRVTWKERFVQFSWKAHCFPVLKTWKERLAKFAHDLGRASVTIFMKSALFSLFRREFWRFLRTLRSKMRFGQNVLRMTWKERFVQFSWKAHCFPVLKRISEPVWRFLRTLPLKNAIWPKRAAHDLGRAFCTFSWKAHCFLFSERIWGQCDDFKNFGAQKCDLAKTCCAWPEKSVLYNFHGKRTVFLF